MNGARIAQRANGSRNLGRGSGASWDSSLLGMYTLGTLCAHVPACLWGDEVPAVGVKLGIRYLFRYLPHVLQRLPPTLGHQHRIFSTERRKAQLHDPAFNG